MAEGEPPKWTKASAKHFLEADVHLACRPVKRCVVSLVVREMQIKTTARSKGW